MLLLCCCCCRVNARCRLTASRPVRTAGRSPRPADERRRSPRSDSQAGAVAPPGGRRPCAPEAIAKRLVPSVVGVAVSVSGVDIQQLARGKAKSARHSGGALARRASHGQIVPPQRHRRDRHTQPHGETAQPKLRRPVAVEVSAVEVTTAHSLAQALPEEADGFCPHASRGGACPTSLSRMLRRGLFG